MVRPLLSIFRQQWGQFKLELTSSCFPKRPVPQSMIHQFKLPLQVLFQFHQERGHWQAAASTAYAFAQLLRTEYTVNQEALAASAGFVRMAISLLGQLPKGSRWISCAWQAGEEILSTCDLEREWKLLQSLSLLRSFGDGEAASQSSMTYQALMLKGRCFC